MADHVLRMAEPPRTPVEVRRQAAGDRVARQVAPEKEEDEEEEPPIERKAEPGAGPSLSAGAGADVAAARSGGVPLPSSERSFFEPRLGRDLGDVRVHADAAAGRSARNLSARAFTAGSDLVFAPGQYAPGTALGRRLLAHELAHVAQHPGSGGIARRPDVVARQVETAAAPAPPHRPPRPRPRLGPARPAPCPRRRRAPSRPRSRRGCRPRRSCSRARPRSPRRRLWRRT